MKTPFYPPITEMWIILPFTLLRRMECFLAPSKDKVLAALGRTAKMNQIVVTYEILELLQEVKT